MFTNLVLVPQQHYAEAEHEAQYLYDVRTGWARLHKELFNRPIDLDELVDFDGEGRGVLILGEAGSGKTTICKKICYSWASLQTPSLIKAFPK